MPLGTEEQFDYVHFETFVIVDGDEFVDDRLIELRDLVLHELDDAQRVLEVLEAELVSARAHRLDVEADVLAVRAVAVVDEELDLVEGRAQRLRTEDLVLIELHAILVVEVDREELLRREPEGHVVRRIEAGEDRVRRLDEDAATRRIVGEVPEGDRMAGGAGVGAVNRLIRLRLDRDADLLVVAEHAVEGLLELVDHRDRVLRLLAQRPLASKPEDDEVRAEDVRDVDRALRAPHRALPVFALGRGVGAVLEGGVEPEARRDEFAADAEPVEKLAELVGLVLDLLDRLRGDVRNGVVVVELDRGEAHLREALDLLAHCQGLTRGRTVDVRSLGDVPRTHGVLEPAHCQPSSGGRSASE